MRITGVALLIMAAAVHAGKVELVAGGGTGGDGSPAKEAKLITPFGVDFDSQGRLHFVEMEKGERLRAVVDGKVVTLAGSGKKGNSGDGGNPLEATFNGMHGLAIGSDDTVYLADTWNNRIRGFKDGKLFAVAGSGKKGKVGDGADAKTADFGGLFGITTDATRSAIVFNDMDQRRVYAMAVSGFRGAVLIVAGNGEKGVPKDGAKAIESPLFDPRAVAVNKEGDCYILERAGHCLRVVNSKNEIKTVAGTGKAGIAVGKALESQMNGPKHLCIDKDQSVIIADAENHRILRYDPKTVTVSVIAGTGKKGSKLNDDPLKCELNRPHGVAVHPKTGELYIVDSYNDRILKISK